jgi:hypothetical protein
MYSFVRNALLLLKLQAVEVSCPFCKVQFLYINCTYFAFSIAFCSLTSLINVQTIHGFYYDYIRQLPLSTILTLS